VLGALIMVLVLVVLFPVGALMTGGALAALFGWSLKAEADDRGEEIWRELNV
jgi:hypothetical protein